MKKVLFDRWRNRETNYYSWFLKVKIEKFSFDTLPSPNTKKNHPKWDLGKDFYFQAFIERWKIKIRAFPRTSRKRFWNGRAMDWRLRDVKVGLQAGKKFCASPIAGLRRAFLCVYRVLFVNERVLTGTEWNARGVNVCSLWSLFICLFVFFPATWKLLWIQNNQC